MILKCKISLGGLRGTPSLIQQGYSNYHIMMWSWAWTGWKLSAPCGFIGKGSSSVSLTMGNVSVSRESEIQSPAALK